MRHYSPDRSGLFTLRILILMMTSSVIILINYFSPLRTASLIADSVIAGISLFIMLIYLPLYFSSVKYTVTDTEIRRMSGVFIKHRQTIRIDTIQYSMMVNSPFSKLTGLNFLVFFVYGGQMNLMFLNYEDMQEILALSGSEGGEMQ
ncbi:MAG: PH domain-containing protein [Ruminococcus sp.]|nr:PH domain-containing protein [Ruminococcus sp.]